VRSEQIKLQVALVNALMHIKGYAAPEPKAAVEQARQFIERAEALGEPPEDPLLLFSVLYGAWAASYVAFDGEVTRDLASQFMALAEKQRHSVPLMIGQRLMGTSMMLTGNIAESRLHYDQSFALYDSARTSASRSSSIARWHSGCSAIPSARSRTPTARSSMRTRRATPPR
jgi:hypothetical protein